MTLEAEATNRALTPVMSAEDVTVRFGGLVALREVSLGIGREGMTGLVGPNGAGKSTLFDVMSGLLRPAAGRVLRDGRDITSQAPHMRARHGLARTFQHPELFLDLSVREHLVLAHRAKHQRNRVLSDAFMLGAWRRSDSEERDRVDDLIARLVLGPVADQPVGSLPLGTSRLVEIGRAMATSPDVLMLDEPMSGLDAYEAERLAEVLQAATVTEGTAVLLVEHDVSMVLKLCRQIFVLDFGRLISSGTPEEIRTSDAVRAAYLGEDPQVRGKGR